MIDYYGEEGCCKTCPTWKKEENRIEEGKCLCFDCKCRKCIWYEWDSFEEKGKCTHPGEGVW